MSLHIHETDYVGDYKPEVFFIISMKNQLQ